MTYSKNVRKKLILSNYGAFLTKEKMKKFAFMINILMVPKAHISRGCPFKLSAECFTEMVSVQA